MKLTWKDLVATLLVVAIGVPYVGYLIDGEMPFVEDPRGMSAVGLVLGLIAFLVLESDDTCDTTDTPVLVVAGAAMVLGLVTFALAETAAAEVLLAVFMGSILVVWAVELGRPGRAAASGAAPDRHVLNRRAGNPPPRPADGRDHPPGVLFGTLDPRRRAWPP